MPNEPSFASDCAMAVSIGYITTATRDDALRIAHALLEDRLIACANVLDGMTSVYRWEGEIREDREAVLILKSRTELTECVTARVRELHTYDCPCIEWWPAASGHPDYLRWVENETAAS
jgi:periplasmic divalent cation tolerance protein